MFTHAAETRNAGETGAVLAQLAVVSRQLEEVLERQRRQEEFIREMTPIAKEMMGAATETFGDWEKRGYFAFGREVGAIAQRVMANYSAQDVKALGDAIVGILDTVRALTQPPVLKVATEAAEVLEKAQDVEPLGITGMVRASRSPDVQQGMAVMMELLRHVGRAAATLNSQRAGDPAQKRKAALASMTASRRKGALGTERTAPRPRAAAPTVNAVAAAPPPPACAVPARAEPVVATVIEGIAFTADGHLVDPGAWTRDIGERVAAGLGVPMTDAHWKIAQFCRDDFLANKVSPNIRRITQCTGVATKELYALFPRAPARTIAKIAGIPKPAGCL